MYANYTKEKALLSFFTKLTLQLLPRRNVKLSLERFKVCSQTRLYRHCSASNKPQVSKIIGTRVGKKHSTESELGISTRSSNTSTPCQDKSELQTGQSWLYTKLHSLTKYVWSLVHLRPTQPESVKMQRIPLDVVTKVKGMKILDRSAFETSVTVPVLAVPISSVGKMGQYLKKTLFRMPGVKPVQDLKDEVLHESHKLFLIDPDHHGDMSSFTEADMKTFREHNVELGSWKLYQIELSYRNFTYSDILGAVLPEDSDGVGGFSTIGHIVHLNLKEELDEYKDIIGEVLLDKVATVQTIVNKTNTINNTYRNFEMEVIAGKADFVTVAKENGFSYKMDFSKVYWNPRLGTEHQRIASQLTEGDVVYDMFAGIGPFAVPAARRKCVVFANDLNPESSKWLEYNLKQNKVKGEFHVSTKDGRQFVNEVIRADLLHRWSTSLEDEDGRIDIKPAIHIIMNLPALAIEFLDAYRGLFHGHASTDFSKLTLPTVHCYCFSKADDTQTDTRRRVEAVLGETLAPDHLIRTVRNVAPQKDMLYVKFTLQPSLLFGPLPCEAHGSDSPLCEAHGSDSPPCEAHGSESPLCEAHGSESPLCEAHGSESPLCEAHGSESSPCEAHGSDSPLCEAHGSDSPPCEAHGSESPLCEAHGSESPLCEAHGSDSPLCEAHGSDSPPSKKHKVQHDMASGKFT